VKEVQPGVFLVLCFLCLYWPMSLVEGRNITSDEYHLISDNFHTYMQENFDKQTQEITVYLHKQNTNNLLHIIWISNQIGFTLPPDVCKKIATYTYKTIQDDIVYSIAHAEVMVMLRYADNWYGNVATYPAPSSIGTKKRMHIQLPAEIADLC
jgi:hypothetical protein